MAMPAERKKNNSIKMTAIWKKCEKFAKILGKPKEEVFLNLDLVNKYSRQLNSRIPHFINMVLKEGQWKTPYDETKYQEELKQRNEKSQSDYVKTMIAQEKYNKEKAEACGYEYKPRETHIEKCKFEPKPNGGIKEDEDPMKNLKLMLWVINKIGSLEKASKIFEAAKLSIEAIRE
jgi:hypothetical protein